MKARSNIWMEMPGPKGPSGLVGIIQGPEPLLLPLKALLLPWMLTGVNS
jgi:hypothetical protein